MIFSSVLFRIEIFFRFSVSLSLRFGPEEEEESPFVAGEWKKRKKIDSNVSKVKDYSPVNVSIPLFKNACIILRQYIERTQWSSFSWTKIFPKQISIEKKSSKEKEKKCFFFSNNCLQQFSTTQNKSREYLNLLSYYDMDKQCGQVIQRSMKSYAWMSVTFQKRLCIVQLVLRDFSRNFQRLIELTLMKFWIVLMDFNERYFNGNLKNGTKSLALNPEKTF